MPSGMTSTSSVHLAGALKRRSQGPSRSRSSKALLLRQTRKGQIVLRHHLRQFGARRSWLSWKGGPRRATALWHRQVKMGASPVRPYLMDWTCLGLRRRLGMLSQTLSHCPTDPDRVQIHSRLPRTRRCHLRISRLPRREPITPSTPLTERQMSRTWPPVVCYRRRRQI